MKSSFLPGQKINDLTKEMARLIKQLRNVLNKMVWDKSKIDRKISRNLLNAL